MDVILDHNILLKKFDKIKNELIEVEQAYRILHRTFSRENSDFFGKCEKDTFTSSFRTVLPKDPANKEPNLNCTSESAEDSTCEDEPLAKKISLQSAVIVRVKNNKSRKDVITKQNINKKVKSRNRRILGMLQSTLQKFQDEAVKRQPQDLKKIMVEQKVEAAKEEEKQKMKREESELYLKINEKRLQLDTLEQMMMIIESFDTWKCNKEKLLNFIITKAKPQICFLPVSHIQSSNKQLEKSRAEIQENINKQEEAMKKKLFEISESYNKFQYEREIFYLKQD